MRRLKRRWWMVGLPFVMGFLLFYVLPFGYSVHYSLVESAFSGRFVGLENYAKVLGNRYYRLALLNTIRLIALGVPMLTLFSLVLALLAARAGSRAVWARAALIMPLLLPSVALVPAFEKTVAVWHGGAGLRDVPVEERRLYDDPFGGCAVHDPTGDR